RGWFNRNGLLFNEKSIEHVRPIQRSPAASNTFSQQSQKASPANPLMPDIYEKQGKSDFLRLHQDCLMKNTLSMLSALATYRHFIDRIDTICRDITIRAAAAITCHEGCDACCEAIGVLPVEAMHIALHLHPDQPPDLGRIYRNSKLTTKIPIDHCPFLENHRCRIYSARPLICRTQGMAFLVKEVAERRLVHCPKNFKGMDQFPADILIDLDKMNEYLIRINQSFLIEIEADILLSERIPLAALDCA
ncbi:MAG: YkgJ family cysteine cluster protein, partial [Thermodesulfobacteriota bacterium]